MMVKQRVTQEFLERSTGYTDKPVAQALSYLQDNGFVNHNHQGWLLIKEKVEQFPLPTQYLEEKYNSDTLGPGRNNSDPVVVVNLNTKDSLTTTTDFKDLTEQVGEIPILQLSKQMMSAIGHLFGKPLHGDPAEYHDLDRLIAYTAQAYDCRGDTKGRIKNPVGFIYWAFHSGVNNHPDKKYINKN